MCGSALQLKCLSNYLLGSGLPQLTRGSLASQSQQASVLYVYEQHWSATGSFEGAAFWWSSDFRRKMYLQHGCCQAWSKTFAFLARVSDLAVPDHSLPTKA